VSFTAAVLTAGKSPADKGERAILLWCSAWNTPGLLLILGVFAPWGETKRPHSSQDRADGRSGKRKFQVMTRSYVATLPGLFFAFWWSASGNPAQND